MVTRSFSIKLAAAALLMLVCLFAAGGMKASAATEITSADISIDAPEDGKTMDFTATITEGTGFKISPTATENYSYFEYSLGRTNKYVLYNGVGWYNNSENKAETKTSKHVINHDYCLIIKLVANDGYYFNTGHFRGKINGKDTMRIYPPDKDSNGYRSVYLKTDYEFYNCDLYDLYFRDKSESVRVNGLNASDILGDGMFSYDAKTKTLNINSGTFDGHSFDGIRSNIPDLTINVNGDATFTNLGIGFKLLEDATITGKGKLTINNTKSIGIATNASLAIKNTSLDISTNALPIAGDYYEDNSQGILTIDNSDITAKAYDNSTTDYGVSAIGYFTGGIKLKNCTIASPSGGKIGTHTVAVSEDDILTYYQINTSDGKGAGSVRITKQGKYIGYCKVTIPYSSYTYRGRGIKPTVTVKDGSTKLVKGTDYTVSYSNNTNVGTATITVTGKGKYAGTYKKTFKVKPLDLSSSYAKVTIPYSSYTYTGSQIKPAVKVKFKDGDIIPTSDYTFSYSNNTKVGVATITVKAKGSNTTGTYKKEFVVKPEKNVIKTISSTKGAFKITWNKATAGATGYQVQYSTDKNFKTNVHSYTSTNLSDLSENFSSVPKSGETWYVKVRSFVTKDGKTSSTRYGNYSDVKTIKIK